MHAVHLLPGSMTGGFCGQRAGELRVERKDGLVIPLLLLIILILVFGVIGALKLAFWVFLIALVAAVAAAFVGRTLISR